jgi:hypothetical protein
MKHRSLQRRIGLSLVVVATACAVDPARATGNFYCAGKTDRGSIALGANIDVDGKILFPPSGHLRLNIEGVEVESERVAVTLGKTWTTLRDRESRQLLIAYRRTNKKPSFVEGVEYEFCSAEHWTGNCWGARIRHADTTGRTKVIDAVCGRG